jgi:hypothetical protein
MKVETYVWIINVLNSKTLGKLKFLKRYMHLHAREIRLSVYQTIKWHLLKQVDLPRSPSTSSVSLMNNNVPEVVTHLSPEVVTNCASNTFQKFQLPQACRCMYIKTRKIRTIKARENVCCLKSAIGFLCAK